MLTITLKNRLLRSFISLPNFFSKNRQLLVRVASGVFLLEAIVLLLLINTWFFSNTSPYALAATALNDKVFVNIESGPAMKQFINDLKSAGLNPILVQKINRPPLSVNGVLIGLNGDNLQVFEYPDHETALKEGEIFAQKYITGSASNRWVNTIHLYIRDKIIVFYMGRDKDILVALNNDKEFFLTKPSVAISRVSN